MKTEPLAMQLRSLAASAPTLHRPALAAAADAVEECARLRAERDEAQRIAAQLRTETGERIYRLERALVATLKERDAARARVAELEQAWRVINSTAPAAALKGDVK